MKALARIDRQLKMIDDLFPAAAAPWHPHAGPQNFAYYCEADELLYGGQPGGGKTELILGLALTAHGRSLILRREAAQLNSIQVRLQELAPGVSGSRTVAIGERVLEFGGCKDESNKVRYKGRPHDLKAFDEITEFTQSQYEYIKAWNRSSSPNQRCRVLATSNPPERQESRWIIDYWSPWLNPQHPNPAISGEIRYYLGKDEVSTAAAVVVGDRLITPRSRCFISASVEDNPVLMASGYDQLLLNLTGDLSRLTGTFFDACEDDPYQVIPTKWVEVAQQRWRDRWGDVHPVTPPDVPVQDAIAGDVARGGKDQSAIATRHGDFVFLWNFAGTETPDAQSFLAKFLPLRRGQATAFIDVIGVGSAVFDLMRAQGHSPVPINHAEKSLRRDRTGQFSFANKRAELYWLLRELLDPAYGATLALPPGAQVLADLTAPRWRLTLQGILIEPKDDIKKRLGRSPDSGDAIVMVAHLGFAYSSSFGMRN